MRLPLRTLPIPPILAILLLVALSTTEQVAPAGNAAQLKNRVYLPVALSAFGGSNAGSLIGVEVTGVGGARDAVRSLTDAQSLGAGFVRYHQINWATLEPVRSRYDFSTDDAALRQVAGVNARPIVIVQGTPNWARPNTSYSSNGPFPGEYLADYARFWKAIVARYSQPPYNVHHWEVYNEPDNTVEKVAGSVAVFGNAPEQYRKHLQTAYQAIKSADPSAMVILGSLAHDYFNDPQDEALIPLERGGAGYFRRDFLDEVLKAGAGPYFDALGFHYYADYEARWLSKKPHLKPNGMAAKVEALRDVLRKHRIDKPVYNTEVGYPSRIACGFNGTVDGQARFLVQMTVRSVATNLQALVWYRLTDDATPNHGDCFAYNGLIGSDGRPKPAFTTFQVTVQTLGAATFVRALSVVELGNSNVEGYLFRDGQGRDLRALWAAPDTAETIAIPGASLLKVTRKDGTTATIMGNRITVTSDPIFVTTN